MVYEIDGSRFSTLEEFFAEFSRVVIPQCDPGSHNLDAFHDVLSGGFGTPDEGFALRWKNHEVSRQRLGYPETVRQLELRLARCHPMNLVYVSRDLEQARVQQGPTVFEWLTEIIRDHGPGGRHAADGCTFCSTEAPERGTRSFHYADMRETAIGVENRRLHSQPLAQ